MDREVQNRFIAAQDELNSLIQDLVRTRSYSGEEKEIVEYIVSKMKQYNFDQAGADGLGNAVGRIGSGPVTILYDAHIDTVQVTETENWKYPPFDGVIREGKIYGRGAVDEKPAMAGYLLAGKILKEIYGSKKLPFTLYVVGSVQEEDFDGYPLQHVIEYEKIRPDYVLLGEPTDLKVYRGQRGRMEMKITTTGKSAHGAHNEKGDNAIYKMAGIIKQVERLDKNLPNVSPLGKGSVTVSNIISRGPSMCSVPDFCQVHLDRRLTVGESRESALAEIEKILRECGSQASVEIPTYQGKSWKGTEFKQEAYYPTWVYEETDTVVAAGLKTMESIGIVPQSSFWRFSTNGVSCAGRLGIPTIGFAPGREELAHSSDEQIDLADLNLAAQFYYGFPFLLTE